MMEIMRTNMSCPVLMFPLFPSDDGEAGALGAGALGAGEAPAAAETASDAAATAVAAAVLTTFQFQNKYATPTINAAITIPKIALIPNDFSVESSAVVDLPLGLGLGQDSSSTT
jgi:hypothetical protein